tara:strand:+ start:1793 stop:3091 length:1299 start_codon:yes stop_codon:yes gene_type:complete
MSNRIIVTKIFPDSNDMELGSMYTGDSTEVSINLNAFQTTTDNPFNQIRLKVYSSNTQLLHYTTTGTTTNNISDMLLVKDIFINCSTSTNTTPYNQSIKCKSPFMVFIVGNPNGLADLNYRVEITKGSKSIDNYKLRDENIEYDEDVLITRPTTDFFNDVQDRNLYGFESWSISCKGSLSNTEYLLQDEAINSSMGFINSNAIPLHSANRIYAVSSGTQDIFGGIGATLLKIHGLDANFKRIFREVGLNALTEIDTLQDFSEVNSAEITETNTSGLNTNAGVITIYNKNPDGGGLTNPLCVIPAQGSISQNPQYCVPADYRLLINRIHIIGFCEDEADLVFSVIVYRNNTFAYIMKKRLTKYHIHGQTNFDIKVDWVVNAGERFIVSGNTITAPTGINKINVQVYGILKRENLGPLSSYTTSTNDNGNTEHI